MPALIFDLDGTLVDTVYAHVFTWQKALQERGMAIDGWRIHRRIGIGGGLFTRAVGRELGRDLSDDEAERDAGAARPHSSGSCSRRRSGGRCPVRSSSWRCCATTTSRAGSRRRAGGRVEPSLEALGVPRRRRSSGAATSRVRTPSRICFSSARAGLASTPRTAT